PALVLAPGEVPEPVADLAEAVDEVLALPPGEIVEAADAGGLQRRLPGRPDAPDHPDRLARQESRRIAPPDYREAARLVEVGGDLGEELVVRQADRAREPQLSLHPIEEPREKYRRRCP